ncbi:iron-siderophore ABC transporter substrate-binding protein [Anabaena sp. FACHB-709]|uniref:Iron(III) dicitrate-binding periplasmic protein n=2 Tax=Nostocaceae TaxID=1162 RepID=A0A1Z4KT13_ANAVA|nr:MULTISPECIES: iron-siderophore ABC transporter substrate-binding protein [Nostocaceae]BAY72074.1 iron(III) dicitrate-binding periplasmic protein [Trichormus variabilis NIES-23]HBW28769.1 iron-siderophore ABC transporter substrate-binding protein [Nostoc sp. UBA8866]MBD2171487.1 iron-siderophore ABC transporter substrate-binding protein [Anabaena cylindrica FACHB-318]MBD2263271.1 iron-siderophore ABC transporter substrate-binding protein [Anabaena sp. FACHB-709]MBD2272816.1 iron-siderophore 
MKKRLLHYYRLIFLITFALVLVTACYSNINDNIKSSKSQPITSECRVIKHPLGETCIPLQPQRIITMDEDILEVLLALDLKPVAVATNVNAWGNRERQLFSKAEGIASIILGNEALPNLEKMVLLHPDLILGLASSTSRKDYELFSQIAPTITLDYVQSRWKDRFLRIGEIMGRREQAQKALTQYQQRVEQLRTIVAKQLGEIKVSVSNFTIWSQTIELRSKFSFPGSVLLEVGLSFPERQNQFSTTPDYPFVSVSMERLELLDADVMFASLEYGSEEKFQKYQNSPLWQKLKVVKNNRLYTVDSGYWIFGNILSANAILDDLYQYLVGKS